MITHLLVALALAAPGGTLADDVKLDDMLAHLQAFQAIADAHGGNRAAGTPGYDASADYVAARLMEAGYTVELQPFRFVAYRQLAPAVLRVHGTDLGKVSTLVNSGAGEVTAQPRRVGAGCADTDFAGFEPGGVAVVDRGRCTFETKAARASTAGAKALIVVNQGGAFDGNAGAPQPIPVVGVDSEQGAAVSKARQVTVVTRTETQRWLTRNVIAQTATGATDDVVMVGAHLDSVEAGPGINDNGSGSAAVLEIALRMATRRPDRAVRFVWWGAEELGLLGSRHYVATLPPEERAKIGMYINVDMVASPNHTFAIYDGDDSDQVGQGPGPEGSARIERAFQDFFTARGLPYTGSDFTGRSDYGPFIAAGIPAGGLFTGAEALKTEAQATMFGGTAGAPLDDCYHKACDDLKNINTHALDVSADAVATVITTFAWRR
ncbi:M28 family metallopeptidase [Nonomuraea africana]|uniref:M28 family metallopeptidase n=1 Tax=Nonomuraea africana TaxID=46171 RepID=UPI0033ED3B95